MKKTILVILVCAAAAASARKFEVALNGGIGLNTLPIGIPNYTYNSDRKTMPASVAGLFKVAYNYKKWRSGLEAGYLNLAYKYRGPVFYYINGQLVQSYGPYKPVKLGNPAIPVKLFADYKVSWKHEEIYGGVSAGYLVLTHMFVPQAEQTQYPLPDNAHGVSAGLQLGGTYFITQQIGINAEIQGNYLVFGHSDYKLYEFPATIGIRFRIGKTGPELQPATNATKS